MMQALSCNNQMNKKMDMEYISSSYRNETEDKIEFSRIVKDSSSFNLIEGEIRFNAYFNTVQTITNKKIISESNIDSIKSSLQEKGYHENFDSFEKIVFVQIQPKNKHDIQILDLRHSIEDKVHNILKDNEIGEWIAGDLGPGGANMLFEVRHWGRAISLIMKILNQEGILNQSLIVKRLNTSKNDWNYKIIYPIDYEGVFNQM